MSIRLLSAICFCCYSLPTYAVESDIRWKKAKVDKAFLNKWPTAWEQEFSKRAETVLRSQVKQHPPKLNTYFENEKRGYGFLMAHVLTGNREKALSLLQAQDHQHQIWHKETEGIDYYACFTLKHQIRKYFLFGDQLDPAYRKKMFTGAKKWTAQDPMRRPHYAYKKGISGWGPDAKNSWVDIRGTSNLFLMRVTSVFLMAEETGNKATTKKYKDYLLKYRKTLLAVGCGEWDSENYLGHTIVPLLNLYDFAKDKEVKVAAKACLDFYAITGALKYFRGSFAGPNKRDYNHEQPFRGSASNSLWLWFGDHPEGKKDHWESDEVHFFTSAYRPPKEAVMIARRQFKKGIEVNSAKPEYWATPKFNSSAPSKYFETLYFGKSYHVGSLLSGTSTGVSDVCGFKASMFDSKIGAAVIQAAPTAAPEAVGSPLYKKGLISSTNRIGQHKNILIWLAQDPKTPWTWVFPEHLKNKTISGNLLIEGERSWFLAMPVVGKLKRNKNLEQKIPNTKKPKFLGHCIYQSKVDDQDSSGKKYGGCVIMMFDKNDENTEQSIISLLNSTQIKLNNDQISVTYTKHSDKTHPKEIKMTWHDNPLQIPFSVDGKTKDFSFFKDIHFATKYGDLISAPRGATELNLKLK